MLPDKRKISLSAEDFILGVARHILNTKGAACRLWICSGPLWSLKNFKIIEENVSKGTVGATNTANEVLIACITTPNT